MAKRAVVTGAARGIGLAVAAELANAGYAVCLVGREPESLDQAVAMLKAGGATAASACGDVSRWEDVERMAAEAESKLGGLDLLVNNAGGWSGEPLADIDVNRMTGLTSTILLGTMYWSKAAVPALRRAGGGDIINIGSTSGLSSSRDSAVASAAKGGVALLSTTLARELAPAGIRVTAVHPARVRKGVDRTTAEAADSGGDYRSISPEQVAEVVAWIARQPRNLLIAEIVVSPAGAPP